MTCDEIRDRLLDHLYDALDDAESAEVVRHLADCAACRGALAAAQAQKDVLAEAARAAAGDVTFTPPVARPRLVPKAWWLSAAAAVLVGAVAAGIDATTARSRAAAGNPVIEVSGASSVARGVPAEYRVTARGIDGRPVPVRFAVARYENGKPVPVGTAEVSADTGETTVAFDPSVLAPGASSSLHFSATVPGRSGPITTVLPVREATRLVTRIATDKPLYRPGEVVRVRGVALESLRLTPAGDSQLRVRVLDPRGGVVSDRTLPTLSGVTAWQETLAEDAPGGTWKVVVSGAQDAGEGLVATSERTFRVRGYRVPRLRFDVELDRASYRIGDRGTAFVKVTRAEGGVPAGAQVDAQILVDGENVFSEATTTVGDGGGVAVPFDLTRLATEEGRVRLSVTVRDGGAVETTSKTIPLVLDELRFEAFPEGGALVAGLPNRVYFRARTLAGEPSDLAAELRDDRGSKVAEVRTDVHGMGAFEFTPRTGATYEVVLAGTGNRVGEGASLRADAAGTTLRALDDEVAAKAAVRVRVGSTAGGRHTVGAWCRGLQVGEAAIDVPSGGTADASVRLRTEVGGVLRVTVFDPAGVPVAERLVSRRPARRLDVAVTPARAKTAPRESQEIAVRVTDETGAPVQAILGTSVVDASVVALADDRDTAPMAFHYLVGMEVEELEDAAVYTSGPDAARAVDRLLGVQGWRRFAWRDPASFAAAHPESGPRIAPVGASDVPNRWTNEADVRRRVGAAVRESARRSTGIAVTLGAAFLLVGGIAVGVRGLLQGRKLAAAGAFSVPAVLVTFVAVALVNARVGLQLGGGADMAVGAASAPGAEVWGAERGAPGAKEEAKGDLVEQEEAADRLADAESQAEGRDRIRDLVEKVALFEEAKSGEEAQDFDVEFAQAAGLFDRIEDKKQRDSRLVARLVREFAHRAAPADGARSDFAEVLQWNPLLLTDAQGEARFTFDTSDSITSFRVSVDAHEGGGALGSGGAEFSNRVPFYAEPKFPVALTAGDEVDLPVVIANDGDAGIDVEATLRATGGLLAAQSGAAGDLRAATNVSAGARGRVLLPLIALQGRGPATLDLEVSGGPGLLDRSRRTIDVHPRGFPIVVNRSGVLEEQDRTTVLLPERLNRVTLRGSLRVYPTTLSTLVDGLESMLQEPHGCFEQASSANYPNVLVMGYIGAEGTIAPDVARRAKEMLDRGYAKLTGYETPKRGYEWFGGTPAHEALTAYGLLEFTDMAKVHPVDAAMIGRTRDWLLSRRDGKGGWLRDPKALDSFGGAPQPTTDAYITWSVTEADPSADVAREVDALAAQARISSDPYVVALAANALANRRHDAAEAVLDRLVRMQRADGGFDAKETSITSSTGINLEVETAAVAALAFSRSPSRLANSEAAVRFLLASRRGGGFGATQATILALRALTAHAKAARRTSSDHDITVAVNGAEVARRFVAKGTPGVVEIGREVVDALVPGENVVTLRTTGGEALPWALTVDYATDLPANDPACAVEIETSLSKAEAAEGDPLEATVVVRNRTDAGQAMTLARLGLPAGAEPRAESLEELKKAGTIDFFELRPREVVLYWRGLAPRAVKTVPVELTAAVPGRFEGPASSVYLYYGDDRKCWSPPLKLAVR